MHLECILITNRSYRRVLSKREIYTERETKIFRRLVLCPRTRKLRGIAPDQPMWEDYGRAQGRNKVMI